MTTIFKVGDRIKIASTHLGLGDDMLGLQGVVVATWHPIVPECMVVHMDEDQGAEPRCIHPEELAHVEAGS
jgi:hypothetical protein